MSQASKALKKLATGDEYKALAAAMESKDYGAIAQSYLKLCELMDVEKRQVQEKILALPRQNKDEDCQKFETALAQRASSALPQWHWLNLQLKEQGVMEGEVFGVGVKGDPLVHTSQGRVVVISGVTLEKGARIKFKVVSQGQKLDFGRVVELNPEYFSYLLNREARDSVKKAFEAADTLVKGGPLPLDAEGLARLADVLQQLEAARTITGKLEAAERSDTASRVVFYRRRLLSDFAPRLAFDCLSRTEEKEIAATCQDAPNAMSAPALFRSEMHRALRAQLLAGDEVKGYTAALKNLEGKMDTMDAAVKLMEFQSSVEKILPSAKGYFQRMDFLFDRLDRKARQIAQTLAEGSVCKAEEISSSITDAFSGESLSIELRRTFRNADDFFALRSALTELRTTLGDAAAAPAEQAVKPYLVRRVKGAFEGAANPKPVANTAVAQSAAAGT